MCIILTDIWAHKRKSNMEKENNIWRIENNEKLDKLIKHKNIVNCIKAQRLSWFGDVKECQIPEQLRRYLNGNP